MYKCKVCQSSSNETDFEILFKRFNPLLLDEMSYKHTIHKYYISTFRQTLTKLKDGGEMVK